MSSALAREKMPKPKKPQEGAGEQSPKTTMKVAVDLIRKAKMVALHRGIDLFDYIEEILKPVVEADYDQMIQQEAKTPKSK